MGKVHIDRKVAVYRGYGDAKIVARVKDHNNLGDSSTTGRYKGITRLRNGCFVMIHGTTRKDERSYGTIITDAEALQIILWSGNKKLLKKYKLGEK